MSGVRVLPIEQACRGTSSFVAFSASVLVSVPVSGSLRAPASARDDRLDRRRRPAGGVWHRAVDEPELCEFGTDALLTYRAGLGSAQPGVVFPRRERDPRAESDTASRDL